MKTPAPHTWIEFTLTSANDTVSVSTNGSRKEHLPLCALDIPRSTIIEFAESVERAAKYERLLNDAGLEAARKIQNTLLEGKRGALFSRLQEASTGQLHVRFVVDDPALQAVPWETLGASNETHGSWGTSADVFPVRTVASSDPWHPRDVPGALEVLAITPTGGAGLSNLKLALQKRIDRGEIKWLDPLEGAVTQVPAILDRLRQGPSPHVLHFLGHGRLNASSLPELRLADKTNGEQTWLAVDILAEH